jgi:cell shape-determining protein MreC
MEAKQVEAKDIISIAGILVTLLVSSATLAYSLWSNKRSFFLNTVTASRLKWIDSLRDKVAEFIAVTARIVKDRTDSEAERLTMQRDALLHQIVLHLNPYDPEDQQIRTLAERAKELTDAGEHPSEVAKILLELRGATADYLKKEWTRVKRESGEAQR